LACLRHALHDRLSIQFRLVLPPLVVVASQWRPGHGPHSDAGVQAGQGQQSGGPTHQTGTRLCARGIREPERTTEWYYSPEYRAA
jgi:hypothetical protein